VHYDNLQYVLRAKGGQLGKICTHTKEKILPFLASQLVTWEHFSPYTGSPLNDARRITQHPGQTNLVSTPKGFRDQNLRLQHAFRGLVVHHFRQNYVYSGITGLQPKIRKGADCVYGSGC
jgi:hypothetical protein